MAKHQNTFLFVPFSRKQLQLQHWWESGSPYESCDMVIADGAIRSGKTIAMICGFFRWSLKAFPSGGTFILAGKTIGSLKRNVILPALQILSAWGIEYYYVSSGSEMRIEIGRSVYYMYDASNERSQDRLQGLTAYGAFADEVALFPRSFVEQMIGRCSVDGARMWLNCNPESPTHYVKTELIDKASEKGICRFHFLMRDNLSLSQRTIERNERMFSGVFYKRFILGEWVQTEGLVYSNFSQETHCVDADEFTAESGRYFISCDYGTLNPCVFLLWCLRDGVATLVRECYWSGRASHIQKTDEDYYNDLDEFAGSLNIESVIIDPSAASFKATIRKHGRFKTKDGKNDVLPGIRYTSTLLSTGHLKIGNCCAETVKEFGLYSWDEKSQSDAVIKENDHCMDALRYFCYTIMRREVVI